MRKIELEGGKYRLKLNKNNCELINIHQDERINFMDGTPVPRSKETKYLGCMLNDRGDSKREVNKRIGECYITWKNWKHIGSTAIAQSNRN